MNRVRLDQFDPRLGLDRGRSSLIEMIWYVVKVLFFLSPWPWPSGWKCSLLRCFGAKIGRGVVIKPRVNIHLPWKLAVGDHCWVGEEVFILNLEPVMIGGHVCLSQRAFLCTGNHDYRQPSFPYRNAPIIVEDGAWIGAQVFVGPGVTVGTEAVVTAGVVVTQNLPASQVCAGQFPHSFKSRW